MPKAASASRSSHTTNATTRTRTGSRNGRPEQLVTAGDELASPESGLRYRVDRLLGQGGFGQVYLARRIGRSRTIPESLCIKVSRRIDGWLREAYFGQLLDDHPRALRIFDAFPIVQADGRPLYCLALEYARHGDLSAFLHRTGRKFHETTARREIAGILQVLGKLHRGQMLHRDLTPMNVFVCDNSRLKLGDFGIVRQQSDRRGITARTLNPLMAPSDIFAGAAPKWQARDDVYQVGQLLGMLIKGDAHARIRAPEVRKLPCSDHLKEIIYRCIGERRKRYESADELIDALSSPPASLKVGRAAHLEGRASGLHGRLQHAAPRSGTGRQARGRGGARHAVDQDEGRGARPAQRAAGRGQGRRTQADGDQAASRQGPSHHDHQRGAVPAADPERKTLACGRLS